MMCGQIKIAPLYLSSVPCSRITAENRDFISRIATEIEIHSRKFGTKNLCYFTNFIFSIFYKLFI